MVKLFSRKIHQSSSTTKWGQPRTKGAQQTWPLEKLGRKSKDEFVQERAYLKWEQAGRPDGMSEHFWQEAEREYRDVQDKPAGHDPPLPKRQRRHEPKGYLRYLTLVAVTKMFSI